MGSALFPLALLSSLVSPCPTSLSLSLSLSRLSTTRWCILLLSHSVSVYFSSLYSACLSISLLLRSLDDRLRHSAGEWVHAAPDLVAAAGRLHERRRKNQKMSTVSGSRYPLCLFLERNRRARAR